MIQRRGIVRTILAAVLLSFTANYVSAQIAYGVNGNGTLFRFDVDQPSVVTEVGAVGFVPEAIDFRPGTSELFAINVDATTTQLYTVNISTAAATAVGDGFASTGVGYALSENQDYGFDFNPTTLQADDSMRIRLVNTAGANLRLNSSTGQIAAVDSNLLFANGNSPFIDAAAYTNNLPVAGGVTQLLDLDTRSDVLVLQNPPNAGTVNTVGAFGVTIDAMRHTSFDIYTDPATNDDTLTGDFGFAVLRRPDAPINGPLGSYLLYDVNLATGQLTNGALVGSIPSPYDFDGGFAVAPSVVPEPSSLTLCGLAFIGLASRLRRAGR